MLKLTIAEKIQDEMKKQNLTIAQLVKKTGISQSTLSEILIGKRTNITSENLIKLSNGLNISVDYMLGLCDTWTTNENYKNVYDEIKINEQSIKNIKSVFDSIDNYIEHLRKNENFEKMKDFENLKIKTIQTLNQLLSYTELKSFLLTFNQYIEFHNKSETYFFEHNLQHIPYLAINSNELEDIYLRQAYKHLIKIKKESTK